MASYVQVVLQESLRNVGASGELVKVRPGFARNFLVPRGLAAYATDKNVARIEHEKREALARAAKLRGEAEAIAKTISEVTVKIARPFGTEDRMYGSVTAKDIGIAFEELGHKIDRRKIELDAPIRTPGVHTVSVRLAPDVSTTFKVEVVKADS
jgi:large subunit ribosomal protein L9